MAGVFSEKRFGNNSYEMLTYFITTNNALKYSDMNL